MSLAYEIRTLQIYPSLKVSPAPEKHYFLLFSSTRLSKIPPACLQKYLVYLFCALLPPLRLRPPPLLISTLRQFLKLPSRIDVRFALLRDITFGQLLYLRTTNRPLPFVKLHFAEKILIFDPFLPPQLRRQNPFWEASSWPFLPPALPKVILKGNTFALFRVLCTFQRHL